MPKNPRQMTDAELEAANQQLMGERARVLAAQREITAEVEGRARAKRVAELEAALAAERESDDLEIGVGDVASLADVLTPE